MAGYARITTTESQIWIRFERIGRGSRFNLLLDAFRSSFPLARWDEHHKAWELSVNQLEQVISFCNRIGLKKEVQDYDTIASSIRQFSLL